MADAPSPTAALSTGGGALHTGRMALGSAPNNPPSRQWIHRVYVGNDDDLLEREIAANSENGYEPVSHSAYWDAKVSKRVISILYQLVR